MPVTCDLPFRSKRPQVALAQFDTQRAAWRSNGDHRAIKGTHKKASIVVKYMPFAVHWRLAEI